MIRRCLPLVLLCTVPSACHRPHLPGPSTDPPVVSVAQPVERDVTAYVDFTGRTDAVFSTDIRARVTGYLTKMPFKEGALVNKDDLLFEVDPRPYQAQLDRAQGDVFLQEAKLKLAKADNARAKNIFKMNPGAISQQDLDKYQAAEEEADAAVKAAKANLEVYKLNLAFCQVTSPIDGQVSRYNFTLGNLVNQDQTQLTTVVSVDPIYAYFDMDERTLLKIKRLLNEKKLVLKPDSSDIPVLFGLQGEEGFPHRGAINFVNNKVDPLTGTITVRGVFANKPGDGGHRLLSPGMFVRIRLPLGKPHPALLVADRALVTDQGLKNVFIVDAESKVQYRRVTPGPLQPDGLRVIEEGLKAGEWVVVSGLQIVRPRMVVTRDRVPMPVISAPGETERLSSDKPE